MKKLLLIWMGILVVVTLNAQEKSVKGKITTYNVIPVSKAEILVKSSNLKFYSDSSGLFSVLCSAKDRLIVSAEGFVTKRINISEKTRYALINLALKPGEKAEELAVGYGHIKDGSRLYAISSKGNSEMDYSGYRNIYEALTGTFPGLQILNGEVIIRNTASFEVSTSALLIVDGREVSKDTFAGIITADIARISVLKDASASVYGVRGGNGVVIVETKRGGDK